MSHSRELDKIPTYKSRGPDSSTITLVNDQDFIIPSDHAYTSSDSSYQQSSPTHNTLLTQNIHNIPHSSHNFEDDPDHTQDGITSPIGASIPIPLEPALSKLMSHIKTHTFDEHMKQNHAKSPDPTNTVSRPGQEPLAYHAFHNRSSNISTNTLQLKGTSPVVSVSTRSLFSPSPSPSPHGGGVLTTHGHRKIPAKSPDLRVDVDAHQPLDSCIVPGVERMELTRSYHDYSLPPIDSITVSSESMLSNHSFAFAGDDYTNCSVASGHTSGTTDRKRRRHQQGPQEDLLDGASSSKKRSSHGHPSTNPSHRRLDVHHYNDYAHDQLPLDLSSPGQYVSGTASVNLSRPDDFDQFVTIDSAAPVAPIYINQHDAISLADDHRDQKDSSHGVVPEGMLPRDIDDGDDNIIQDAIPSDDDIVAPTSPIAMGKPSVRTRKNHRNQDRSSTLRNRARPSIERHHARNLTSDDVSGLIPSDSLHLSSVSLEPIVLPSMSLEPLVLPSMSLEPSVYGYHNRYNWVAESEKPSSHLAQAQQFPDHHEFVSRPGHDILHHRKTPAEIADPSRCLWKVDSVRDGSRRDLQHDQFQTRQFPGEYSQDLLFNEPIVYPPSTNPRPTWMPLDREPSQFEVNGQRHQPFNRFESIPDGKTIKDTGYTSHQPQSQPQFQHEHPEQSKPSSDQHPFCETPSYGDSASSNALPNQFEFSHSLLPTTYSRTDDGTVHPEDIKYISPMDQPSSGNDSCVSGPHHQYQHQQHYHHPQHQRQQYHHPAASTAPGPTPTELFLTTYHSPFGVNDNCADPAMAHSPILSVSDDDIDSSSYTRKSSHSLQDDIVDYIGHSDSDHDPFHLSLSSLHQYHQRHHTKNDTESNVSDNHHTKHHRYHNYHSYNDYHESLNMSDQTANRQPHLRHYLGYPAHQDMKKHRAAMMARTPSNGDTPPGSMYDSDPVLERQQQQQQQHHHQYSQQQRQVRRQGDSFKTGLSSSPIKRRHPQIPNPVVENGGDEKQQQSPKPPKFVGIVLPPFFKNQVTPPQSPTKLNTIPKTRGIPSATTRASLFTSNTSPAPIRTKQSSGSRKTVIPSMASETSDMHEGLTYNMQTGPVEYNSGIERVTPGYKRPQTRTMLERHASPNLAAPPTPDLPSVTLRRGGEGSVHSGRSRLLKTNQSAQSASSSRFSTSKAGHNHGNTHGQSFPFHTPGQKTHRLSEKPRVSGPGSTSTIKQKHFYYDTDISPRAAFPQIQTPSPSAASYYTRYSSSQTAALSVVSHPHPHTSSSSHHHHRDHQPSDESSAPVSPRGSRGVDSDRHSHIGLHFHHLPVPSPLANQTGRTRGHHTPLRSPQGGHGAPTNGSGHSAQHVRTQSLLSHPYSRQPSSGHPISEVSTHTPMYGSGYDHGTVKHEGTPRGGGADTFDTSLWKNSPMIVYPPHAQQSHMHSQQQPNITFNGSMFAGGTSTYFPHGSQLSTYSRVTYNSTIYAQEKLLTSVNEIFQSIIEKIILLYHRHNLTPNISKHSTFNWSDHYPSQPHPSLDSQSFQSSFSQTKQKVSHLPLIHILPFHRFAYMLHSFSEAGSCLVLNGPFTSHILVNHPSVQAMSRRSRIVGNVNNSTPHHHSQKVTYAMMGTVADSHEDDSDDCLRVSMNHADAMSEHICSLEDDIFTFISKYVPMTKESVAIYNPPMEMTHGYGSYDSSFKTKSKTRPRFPSRAPSPTRFSYNNNYYSSTNSSHQNQIQNSSSHHIENTNPSSSTYRTNSYLNDHRGTLNQSGVVSNGHSGGAGGSGGVAESDLGSSQFLQCGVDHAEHANRYYKESIEPFLTQLSSSSTVHPCLTVGIPSADPPADENLSHNMITTDMIEPSSHQIKEAVSPSVLISDPPTPTQSHQPVSSTSTSTSTVTLTSASTSTSTSTSPTCSWNLQNIPPLFLPMLGSYSPLGLADDETHILFSRRLYITPCEVEHDQNQKISTNRSLPLRHSIATYLPTFQSIQDANPYKYSDHMSIVQSLNSALGSKISSLEFTNMSRLSKGNYNDVYRAVVYRTAMASHHQTEQTTAQSPSPPRIVPQPVVVKISQRSFPSEGAIVKAVQNEVLQAVLADTSPYIVRNDDVWIESSKVYVAGELCPLTLPQYIHHMQDYYARPITDIIDPVPFSDIGSFQQGLLRISILIPQSSPSRDAFSEQYGFSLTDEEYDQIISSLSSSVNMYAIRVLYQYLIQYRMFDGLRLCHADTTGVAQLDFQDDLKGLQLSRDSPSMLASLISQVRAVARRFSHQHVMDFSSPHQHNQDHKDERQLRKSPSHHDLSDCFQSATTGFIPSLPSPRSLQRPQLHHPAAETPPSLNYTPLFHSDFFNFHKEEALIDNILFTSELPNKHIFQIAYHLTLALESTHQHGIIHMDVKPDNILIGSDGKVKLCDYGNCVVDIRYHNTLGDLEFYDDHGPSSSSPDQSGVASSSSSTASSSSASSSSTAPTTASVVDHSSNGSTPPSQMQLAANTQQPQQQKQQPPPPSRTSSSIVDTSDMKDKDTALMQLIQSRKDFVPSQTIVSASVKDDLLLSSTDISESFEDYDDGDVRYLACEVLNRINASKLIQKDPPRHHHFDFDNGNALPYYPYTKLIEFPNFYAEVDPEALSTPGVEPPSSRQQPHGHGDSKSMVKGEHNDDHDYDYDNTMALGKGTSTYTPPVVVLDNTMPRGNIQHLQSMTMTYGTGAGVGPSGPLTAPSSSLHPGGHPPKTLSLRYSEHKHHATPMNFTDTTMYWPSLFHASCILHKQLTMMLTGDIQGGHPIYSQLLLDLPLVPHRPPLPSLIGKPSTAVDIFSLGLTLLEIVVGCPPPRSGEYWKQLRSGDLPMVLHIFEAASFTLLQPDALSCPLHKSGLDNPMDFNGGTSSSECTTSFETSSQVSLPRSVFNGPLRQAHRYDGGGKSDHDVLKEEGNTTPPRSLHRSQYGHHPPDSIASDHRSRGNDHTPFPSALGASSSSQCLCSAAHIPRGISMYLRVLIISMLSPIPYLRPTIEEIHGYIKLLFALSVCEFDFPQHEQLLSAVLECKADPKQLDRYYETGYLRTRELIINGQSDAVSALSTGHGPIRVQSPPAFESMDVQFMLHGYKILTAPSKIHPSYPIPSFPATPPSQIHLGRSSSSNMMQSDIDDQQTVPQSLSSPPSPSPNFPLSFFLNMPYTTSNPRHDVPALTSIFSHVSPPPPPPQPQPPSHLPTATVETSNTMNDFHLCDSFLRYRFHAYDNAMKSRLMVKPYHFVKPFSDPAAEGSSTSDQYMNTLSLLRPPPISSSSSSSPSSPSSSLQLPKLPPHKTGKSPDETRSSLFPPREEVNFRMGSIIQHRQNVSPHIPVGQVLKRLEGVVRIYNLLASKQAENHNHRNDNGVVGGHGAAIGDSHDADSPRTPTTTSNPHKSEGSSVRKLPLQSTIQHYRPQHQRNLSGSSFLSPEPELTQKQPPRRGLFGDHRQTPDASRINTLSNQSLDDFLLNGRAPHSHPHPHSHTQPDLDLSITPDDDNFFNYPDLTTPPQTPRPEGIVVAMPTASPCISVDLNRFSQLDISVNSPKSPQQQQQQKQQQRGALQPYTNRFTQPLLSHYKQQLIMTSPILYENDITSTGTATAPPTTVTTTTDGDDDDMHTTPPRPLAPLTRGAPLSQFTMMPPSLVSPCDVDQAELDDTYRTPPREEMSRQHATPSFLPAQSVRSMNLSTQQRSLGGGGDPTLFKQSSVPRSLAALDHHHRQTGGTIGYSIHDNTTYPSMNMKFTHESFIYAYYLAQFPHDIVADTLIYFTADFHLPPSVSSSRPTIEELTHRIELYFTRNQVRIYEFIHAITLFLFHSGILSTRASPPLYLPSFPDLPLLPASIYPQCAAILKQLHPLLNFAAPDAITSLLKLHRPRLLYTCVYPYFTPPMSVHSPSASMKHRYLYSHYLHYRQQVELHAGHGDIMGSPMGSIDLPIGTPPQDMMNINTGFEHNPSRSSYVLHDDCLLTELLIPPLLSWDLLGDIYHEYMSHSSYDTSKYAHYLHKNRPAFARPVKGGPNNLPLPQFTMLYGNNSISYDSISFGRYHLQTPAHTLAPSVQPCGSMQNDGDSCTEMTVTSDTMNPCQHPVILGQSYLPPWLDRRYYVNLSLIKGKCTTHRELLIRSHFLRLDRLVYYFNNLLSFTQLTNLFPTFASSVYSSQYPSSQPALIAPLLKGDSLREQQCPQQPPSPEDIVPPHYISLQLDQFIRCNMATSHGGSASKSNVNSNPGCAAGHNPPSSSREMFTGVKAIVKRKMGGSIFDAIPPVSDSLSSMLFDDDGDDDDDMTGVTSIPQLSPLSSPSSPPPVHMNNHNPVAIVLTFEHLHDMNDDD